MARTLIITSGDQPAGVLARAYPHASVLPWRDILYEGPVPLTNEAATLNRIRAAYLSHTYPDAGRDPLGELDGRDETLARLAPGAHVELWLDHDLNDQLQLLQIMDGLARLSSPPASLDLVPPMRPDASSSPNDPAGHHPRRSSLGAPHMALAQRAWDAVRQPTPVATAGLLDADLSLLPALRPALARWLDELPGLRHGLSLTERRTLRLLRTAGAATPSALFAALQSREPAPFLGDWSFFVMLDRLADLPAPLIDGLHDGPFRPDLPLPHRQCYYASLLRLTVLGSEVVAGREDYLAHAAMERWWGGTHLTPSNVWRWDGRTSRLTPPTVKSA